MVQGDGEPLAWFDELVDKIREWHVYIIEETGGASGENTARLLGSVGRAFQTAFGEDLFADDLAKAAALFHGIITSHAFTDGNKRTATATAFLFLISRGYLPDVPEPLRIRMLGDIALETASGGLSVEDVARWFHRVLDP